MTELDWKMAMVEGAARHVASLKETDLNEAAIKAMMSIYHVGWRDALTWAIKVGGGNEH